MEDLRKIAIIGGGASGIFAAIRVAEVAKEQGMPIEVVVFESSNSTLKKVRISGGGRCNVTHHQFEISKFLENYPRGNKELRSPFQIFSAQDTVEWFSKRGVKLKWEDDGRMFPVTDKSQTIIDCFLQECERLKVKVETNNSIQSIKKRDNGFQLLTHKSGAPTFDSVLIATGSSKKGYEFAKSLGHSITELAPSLFSFKIQSPFLYGLSGTSFKKAKLKLVLEDQKQLFQEGPILITHWGISGPALLKLSAWGARAMKKANYKGMLIVNWLGFANYEEARKLFVELKANSPKQNISNSQIPGLTKRFWLNFLEACEIDPSHKWADVSKRQMNLLTQNLFQCELIVDGKNRYKDEFVECGGVNLKEVNFKTFESKICPGLYFTGEILDVDGITGGFNFQNAWTSGFIAGTSLAQTKTT